MAGFTDAALEKKLSELNNSQQSIQTLSLWLIHHRKHHKSVVQIWFKELRKAIPSRKLTFMYLANDVIQNSKKKGPEYPKEFSTILSKAFAHVNEMVVDDKTSKGLGRIIDVWEDRSVYDANIISGLRAAMVKKVSSKKVKKEVQAEKPKKKKIKISAIAPTVKKKEDIPKVESPVVPPVDPPKAEVLIKALQDLENSPSTDAIVREKIAKFPPEVSDITLLEKIQTREAAEKLSRQVEEASRLLTEYNGRLNEEMEDRKQVSKMLNDFTQAQRMQVALAEVKLQEFKDQLKRVSRVRSELKSHLQNLPDLTLLPSVTGGLAPLPSAGDLFQ